MANLATEAFLAINETLSKNFDLPLWVNGRLEDDKFIPLNSSGLPYQNEWGNEYVEWWMQSPFLKKVFLITPYEENPYLLDVYNWMVESYPVPLIAITLYVIGVFGGQKLMESREAFDLRKALAWWNIFLSVFSTIGAIRVLPEIVYKANVFGLHELTCGHPEYLYGSGAVGLWVQLFILSKLAELIDTVFLVLHKKPVIFLHWYHHVTVLVFCWFTYVRKNPGVIFCGMNYTVHAIMYFYYYLQAADRKSFLFTTLLPMLGYEKDAKGSCKTSFKKKFMDVNASRITTMQTSQMVIGVMIAVYYMQHPECSKEHESKKGAVDWSLMEYCALMYSSYFILFAKVYYDKFVHKKDRSAQTDKVSNPNVPNDKNDKKNK
jgi:hypothetical protein